MTQDDAKKTQDDAKGTQKDAKVSKRDYSLDEKVEALNELDSLDGNFAAFRKSSDIPYSTIQRWRRKEEQLRRQHRQRRARERDRLFVDLQLNMLKRGKKALERMDEKMLENAPLNQLATALGSLISHALKLSDVIEETHGEKELVIRFEYDYDGEIHETPPWSEGGDREPSALQGDRLREAMGEDHFGQNGATALSAGEEETRLVAGADVRDGEPGLAGLESGHEAYRGGEDQRERASH